MLNNHSTVTEEGHCVSFFKNTFANQTYSTHYSFLGWSTTIGVSEVVYHNTNHPVYSLRFCKKMRQLFMQ